MTILGGIAFATICSIACMLYYTSKLLVLRIKQTLKSLKNIYLFIKNRNVKKLPKPEVAKTALTGKDEKEITKML